MKAMRFIISTNFNNNAMREGVNVYLVDLSISSQTNPEIYLRSAFKLNALLSKDI